MKGINEYRCTHQIACVDYCTSATSMVYFHHNNRDKRRRNDGRRASAILTISRLEPHQNEEKRQRVFLCQKMETLRCLPGSGFKSGSNHRRACAGEASQHAIKDKASSNGWPATAKKLSVVARTSLKVWTTIRDGPRDSLPDVSIHTPPSFGKVLYNERGYARESECVPMDERFPPICWKCNQLIIVITNTGLCYSCKSSLVDKVTYHKGRARKKGCEATLTTAQWIAKLRSSQGYCFYCHKYIGYQFLVLEHFIPIAKGGGTTLENCVPACQGCNSDRWIKEHVL